MDTAASPRFAVAKDDRIFGLICDHEIFPDLSGFRTDRLRAGQRHRR
jgi:hypothetical protein